MKTADRARGKWRGILISLGVDERFLTATHGPCPFCEGRDRFRFDNKEAKGTFFCSQCGAGDGIEFVKRALNVDFRAAAKAIDEICGGVSAERTPDKLDEVSRKKSLNALWGSATRLNGDDMASQYLAGRNVLPSASPTCLRFSARCPIPNGGGYGPALLALVVDETGEPANIHRTFLGPQGKADMDNPRALMPGKLPESFAVRLYPVKGNKLGIAEGIETAIAAAKRFGMPVWSAINSTGLAKWSPPHGVDEVHIFGDCDPKYGGQAAAYALAHKIASRPGMTATVHIPDETGKDWADVA